MDAKTRKLARHDYFLVPSEPLVDRMLTTTTRSNSRKRIFAAYLRGLAYMDAANYKASRPKMPSLDERAKKLRLKPVDIREMRKIGYRLASTYKVINKRHEARQYTHTINRALEIRNNEDRRAIFYALRNAFNHGIARSLLNAGVTKVYRRTEPDCCELCAKLLKDQFGKPKIFDLARLILAGDSVDSKKKPVVGMLHPHCRCSGPIPVIEDAMFDKFGKVRVLK